MFVKRSGMEVGGDRLGLSLLLVYDSLGNVPGRIYVDLRGLEPLTP